MTNDERIEQLQLRSEETYLHYKWICEMQTKLRQGTITPDELKHLDEYLFREMGK